MSEFINAVPARAAFFELLNWLKDDDVMCWWLEEAVKYFEECCYVQMHRCASQNALILCDYVYAFISGGRKNYPRNPYRIAKSFGIVVPDLMHESVNDVTAIVQLLSGLNFPQSLLAAPAQKATAKREDRKSVV